METSKSLSKGAKSLSKGENTAPEEVESVLSAKKSALSEKIRGAKLIVVKVGTSILTYPTGFMNIRRVEELIKCLSDLQNAGKKIVLVSSGAIGCGVGKIGLSGRELTTEQKQAAASVGQCELVDMYSRLFCSYSHTVGQLLLTRDVTDISHRRKHAENTLKTLIELGCIPIINENDSVSSDEIMYGGNDTLASTVALLCKADLLINLSDVDGFYDSDPKTDPEAKLIPYVAEITPELEAKAGGAGTRRGIGGMAAKLRAAKMCAGAGIPMVVASGLEPAILYDIVEGNFKGTLFDTASAANAANAASTADTANAANTASAASAANAANAANAASAADIAKEG